MQMVGKMSSINNQIMHVPQKNSIHVGLEVCIGTGIRITIVQRTDFCLYWAGGGCGDKFIKIS